MQLLMQVGEVTAGPVRKAIHKMVFVFPVWQERARLPLRQTFAPAEPSVHSMVEGYEPRGKGTTAESVPEAVWPFAAQEA